MKTRLLIFAFGCGLLCSLNANAQLTSHCPYAGHAQDLICLIPDVTQAGNTPLVSFNTTIAQVLGQLPLAVPNSGFVLGFKNGVPVDLTQNLGSVLTERGNTIGRNKLFLGFTFQRFVFHTVDGNNLSSIPFFSVDSSGVANASIDSLHANINQYTTFAAFGLTNRVDVSVSIPFQRISVSGARSNVQTWTGTTYLGLNTATTYAPGIASGFGDLLLSVKASVLPGEGRSRMALGAETRFPTGNVYNLLGTGAYGVKPYVVYSRLLGNFTPHVNVGFQANGFSVLRLNPCFANGTCPAQSFLKLPNSLDYSAGMDIGLVRRKLSMVADLVGQRYFNAPRVVKPAPVSTLFANAPPPCVSSTTSCSSLPSVSVNNSSSYDVDNLSIGLKVSPGKNVIISANALIRLDSAGLRPDRFVPLAGISYVFGK